MKTYLSRTLTVVIALSLVLILASSLWAGEVITSDARSWAKKALEEEKALKTVEGKNTLSVLYFHNKTGQPGLDPLQKGMALMLITDLSSVEGLQVIERTKLQALAEEMGLGASGLVDPDTAPRVGKLLGAQWMLGGDIAEGKPEVLQLQSQLLNVPDSRVLGQSASEGALTEFFRIEKDILFDTIKLLQIEITPEKETKLRKPCSTDNAALMALFQGIDASDRGNYKEAAELYKKALKKDPGICIAKDALSELEMLNLVMSRSRELAQGINDQTSLTNQLTPTEPEYRKPEPKNISTPLNIDLRFQQ